MNTRIVAAIAVLLATSTPIHTEPGASRADGSHLSSMPAPEDRSAPEVLDRPAEATAQSMAWKRGSPIQTGEFLHTLSEGVELGWTRQFAPGRISSHDQPCAVVMDDLGNAYVTGSSDSALHGSDFLTLRYDATGAQVWVRRYNGPSNGHERATALALDSGGNLYVAGAVPMESSS